MRKHKSLKKILSTGTLMGILMGIFSLVSAVKIKAICPVCTIAVGAGLTLTQQFGIDDAITGIWIGGLTVSTIFWIIGWLEKRGKKSKIISIVTALTTYLLVIVPLLMSGTIGSIYNKLWGIDKIALGMFVGSTSFYLAAQLHYKLKDKNDNKVYFPFQKVVIPVFSMVIISFIFVFIVY